MLCRSCTNAVEALYYTYSIRVGGYVHKKLTITVDEKVYNGLRTVVGPRHISQFIEDLVRPQVLREPLNNGYAEMAKDEKREKEALEWADGLIDGVGDAAR
jgi:hypothetical protein